MDSDCPAAIDLRLVRGPGRSLEADYRLEVAKTLKKEDPQGESAANDVAPSRLPYERPIAELGQHRVEKGRGL